MKMAPAETTRPLFYFSAHNYARPTRIKPAGEHMFVANVREYQGQRAPGARVVARAAPAISRFWTITHRKKLKILTCRPSYLDDGYANPLPVLVCCQVHRGAAFARLNDVFLRGLAKNDINGRKNSEIKHSCTPGRAEKHR